MWTRVAWRLDGLMCARRALFGFTRPWRVAVWQLRPARWIHASNPRLGQVPFLLADIGEGIAEVEVLQWFVKEGDTVSQFDKVCEVQSDKANVEITSRYDGVITKLHYNIGEMAKVGSPLMTIDVEGTDDASQPDQGEIKDAVNASGEASSTNAVLDRPSGGKILTTPAVRRIAKENNVDLSTLKGSGPKGRILKEDVLAIVRGGACKVEAKNETPDSLRSDRIELYGNDTTEKIGGIGRIMVQTMTAAAHVPTLTLHEEVEMDNLANLRGQLKIMMAEQGRKISYMPFIIKSVSLSLREYPLLNSYVNSDCTEITYKSAHNIGIAMDTPRGLLVPVIKNVERRSIASINEELSRLQQLGSQGKLGQEDLSGGTFSLSNIGSIGGTYASPILVVPQVVIGATGRFQTLPRFDANGNVVARTIMPTSWSADHRVVDGATITRFSNLFKKYLENPSTMLLDLV